MLSVQPLVSDRGRCFRMLRSCQERVLIPHIYVSASAVPLISSTFAVLSLTLWHSAGGGEGEGLPGPGRLRLHPGSPQRSAISTPQTPHRAARRSPPRRAASLRDWHMGLDDIPGQATPPVTLKSPV